MNLNESIEKLIIYKKNKQLINKLIGKIRREFEQHILFYIVKNKNTKNLVIRDKHYRYLSKKNKYFIKNYYPLQEKIKNTKKIWICWLQGYSEAPALVKACIESFKQSNSGYEIVILTEKNISKYITFPDYIETKYKKGIISKTHYSDLLRVSLLCKYGGVWADATVLCTDFRFIEHVSKMPLFVFKEMDLIRKDANSIVASSWFISSNGESKILMLTRDLLYKYWKYNNLLIDYFTFHLFFSMATRRFPDEWNKIPTFNNHSPHTLMFELKDKYNETRWNQIIKMSNVHKLTYQEQFDEVGTNYDYIIKKYGINRN